jgi:DNA-binding NarL/FixJ family response regulator
LYKHNNTTTKDKISVLLVDDALIITKRISDMLQEIEIVGEIFVASTFLHATEIVEEKTPDLVLLDIHLSDKSGIELLTLLHTDYPAIKVIMVSNKASEYYRELCATMGANSFIDKSKEFEMIPSVIDNLFKR